jgi:hypothetical protein
MGDKWRVDKHDGRRFQIVAEFDTEDEADAKAKTVGDS